MKVTIMGSGASAGVPVPGAGWGKCDPSNPKNNRTRPSVLIDTQGKRLLVDTSPDLRAQLLKADVAHLDGVIYTHAHADHLHGIDDLRGINRAMAKTIPVYADASTLEHIERRFEYVLTPLPEWAEGYYYKPTLEPHLITAGERVDVAGVSVATFDQDHGHSRTVGLRVGSFGYTTDLVHLPEFGFEALQGVHTWVIGVFTDREHATHVNVENALKWIERVSPARAVLTHLGPDLDFAALTKTLPRGVEAAYDGMVIDVPDL